MVVTIIVLIAQLLIFLATLFVLFQIKKVKDVFDELILSFVNSNQTVYETQKRQIKKLADNGEAVLRQIRELNLFRSAINTLDETSKSVGEINITMKELKSISRNMATISNNLKGYK